MLKYCVKATEALKRLRMDKDGVVSLEYVVVAACVVGVVILVFTGTGVGTLTNALQTGFNAIATAMAGVTTP